jgi:WD40 repeat protein
VEKSKEIQLSPDFVSANSASFSVDGKRALTTHSDKTARLWNAETGKAITIAEDGEPLMLKAQGSSINAASFSTDGKRVVTASGGVFESGKTESTARLWDAETGKTITVAGGVEPIILKGHTEAVNAASFSPDGKRVVTASDDQSARLWDAETGIVTAVLIGHEKVVKSASFSPDGARVVTASGSRLETEHSVRVWDAETGKGIAVLKGHTDGVNAASFSPDGKRVVTASEDQTARIWTLQAGKKNAGGAVYNSIVLKGDRLPFQIASFSPDGKRVMTASIGMARLWDAESGKDIAILNSSNLLFLAATSFSSDGRRISMVDSGGLLQIWDVSWISVYGSTLRDRVCAEKLIGAQEFTDAELADPILSSIDPTDPVARNPCLRRGPLHWEYYTQAASRWSRWFKTQWASLVPTPKPDVPAAP